MKLRRVVLLFGVLISACLSYAQGKFDFNKMKAEAHDFIIKEAALTSQEAARLFPVYDEMKAKQRVFFDKIRAIHASKPTTEREAYKMIEQVDAYEIKLKQIEEHYHKEMLKTVSATKLLQVLEAERHFHRQMFRKMARNGKSKFGGR